MWIVGLVYPLQFYCCMVKVAIDFTPRTDIFETGQISSIKTTEKHLLILIMKMSILGAETIKDRLYCIKGEFLYKTPRPVLMLKVYNRTMGVKKWCLGNFGNLFLTHLLD